jgi:hypothetical protein
MYGESEFDDPLEVLGRAAQQAGSGVGLDGASPRPPPEEPLAGGQGTPAGGPQTLPGLPEEGEDEREWPEPGKLDSAKLASARLLRHGYVPEGWTLNDKLTGFQPNATKPRSLELWQVIMERDKSRKMAPKNWKLDRAVKWLTAKGNEGEPDSGEPPPGDGASPEHISSGDDSGGREKDKKQRWTQVKMVRLFHVCTSEELKPLFIARDRKLTRHELDANARDDFWQKAALMFNSPDAKFHLLSPRQGESHDANFYDHLLPGLKHTSYVADPEKLKKEFGTTRTLFTKVYNDFKRSGEGANPSAEKVAEDQENEANDMVYRPHGSSFWCFCQGNVVMDYMYTMFLKYDLLENVTTNMPTGTGFNSAGAADHMSTRGGAPGASKKTKGRSFDPQSLMSNLVLPPLKVFKTSGQRAAELAMAQRQVVKLELDLNKVLTLQEARLQQVQRQCDQPGLTHEQELELTRSLDFEKQRIQVTMSRLSSLQYPTIAQFQDPVEEKSPACQPSMADRAARRAAQSCSYDDEDPLEGEGEEENLVSPQWDAYGWE